MYAVLKLNKTATILVSGQKITLPLELAEGSIGALLVFRTKKAARAYGGKGADIVELEFAGEPNQ